jgi:hypothetical protein
MNILLHHRTGNNFRNPFCQQCYAIVRYDNSMFFTINDNFNVHIQHLAVDLYIYINLNLYYREAKESIMSTLERIVDLKEQLFKTDADFERIANLSPKLFDKWMRGSHSYNKYITNIANALNTTTDYLLGKTNDPTPPNSPPIDAEIHGIINDIKTLPPELREKARDYIALLKK